MKLRRNPILDTDSYKVSHYCQYPRATRTVYSYYESRGGEFDETMFFGLQYIIKQHLLNPVLNSDIDEAKAFFADHFGNERLFYEPGWRKLVEKHGGFFPIEIRAVPEGLSVPTGNVLMTVENTDEDFWWLTNYLETLLCQIWYPCTIATNSREIKRIIYKFLCQTSDSETINADLLFKLHDFGFRGVSCTEQAGIGGAAHLVNFMGTDTMAGIVTARDYYGAGMTGYSIPAAEHSTITAWGREHEYDGAFRNMLEQFPVGLVAVVSDSYNFYEACKAWGTEFRDQVLSRDGTLVVRPDSGYPPHVVCRGLDILGQHFGVTENSKGYKVLPPQVRMIQGDGIDRAMVKDVLTMMKAEGWSADNIAFGSGGGLLQRFNRDTCKFAFKCSAIKVDHEWREDISKDPVTDPGKRSKAGRLELVRNTGWQYKTVSRDDYNKLIAEGWDGMLDTVYRDGELLFEQTFEEIRERAKLPS